ncbi:hypothetical protein HDU90_008930 [Geranomyces variabilis]|nr:hypothetical protein HDU90_008930 [Geranomyces variabilis]
MSYCSRQSISDSDDEEVIETSGDSDDEEVIVIEDDLDEEEEEDNRDARLTYVGIKPEHRTLLTEALKQYPSDVFEAVKHILVIKKESTVTKKKKTITLIKYLSQAPPMKKNQLTFHAPTVKDLKEAFSGRETEEYSTLEVLTARTWNVFQIASGKLTPDQLFALFAQV